MLMELTFDIPYLLASVNISIGWRLRLWFLMIIAFLPLLVGTKFPKTRLKDTQNILPLCILAMPLS